MVIIKAEETLKGVKFLDREFLEALSSMLDKKLDEKLEPIKNDIADLKEDVGTLKADVSILKSDVSMLKSDVTHIKKKVDSVYDQTADLTEFRTDVLSKLDSVDDDISTIETVTASNYLYINKLKRMKSV
ncbi:hypothetical protein SAMN02745163_00849 [Clostridium cavendishii DSM 21758]|uniref:Uncharacterized protein n=1 Tax=Clostridium cavendishii DSM 21758 TaxID=1121302 RepID=A0A1M6EGL2_9CLOT|nr:hypothetical protein SAMN02745163_00849 [Clostridium cavendishii DSM 21758]